MAFKEDTTPIANKEQAVTKKALKADTITTGKMDVIYHTDRKNRRAVLFAHGFTGSQFETWTGDGRSFPDLIANDERLDDFDIFIFGYRTSWFRGSPINHVANELAAQVEEIHEWSAKKDRRYELAIIAHSMGGLACMRYILDQLIDKNTIPPISGLLLYGTPTNGSELVNVARHVGAGLALKVPIIRTIAGFFLRAQRQIAEMKPASEFIQKLQAEWARHVLNGGHPAGGGARMWLPVRVVTGDDDLVVSEASGKGMYGAIDWRTLPYGHRQVCKPESTKDDRYQAAHSFLRQCREAKSNAVLDQIWGISRQVWSERNTKLIRNWIYRVELFAEQKHASQESWIREGFAPCSVEKCTYTTLLTELEIRIGAAFGNTATDAAWRKDPSYVHQINIDAVDKAEQERLMKLIDARLKTFPNNEKCWDDLFPRFEIALTHPVGSKDPNDTFTPTYMDTERDGFELTRRYRIPPEREYLKGHDVTLSISYDSVAPATLTSFEAFCKWLTDVCDVRVRVNGKFNYFVRFKRAINPAELEMKPEDYETLHLTAIRSDSLLLPGTSVAHRWEFPKPQANQGAGVGDSAASQGTSRTSSAKATSP